MARLKEKEREYHHERIIRRQGPQIVRPVIQQRATQSTSSRETLLAGAGVTVIGQRRKPHQLYLDQDSSTSGGGGPGSDTSSHLSKSTPLLLLLTILLYLLYTLFWQQHTLVARVLLLWE
jgi:hypothetical protein